MRSKNMMGIAAGLAVATFTLGSYAIDLIKRPDMIFVKSGASVMTDGSGYDVQNSMSKSFLVYKSQTFGINLGWSKDGGHNIAVKKKSGSGNVVYGELVAIKVKDKWLKYARRDNGINLSWSDSPVYEWKIEGGEANTPVQLNQPAKIFSTVENDNFIYCYRKTGAWLKWTKTCSTADLAAAKGGAPSF